MNQYIVVWFDNVNKEFNNDHYMNVSKQEAITMFYENHDNSAVLINIIEI